MKIRLNRIKVLASHFSYTGDSGDRDRFPEARPIDRGDWLLHGHALDRWRQRGRMISVGVDGWGWRSVAEATIVEVIREGIADLTSIVDLSVGTS